MKAMSGTRSRYEFSLDKRQAALMISGLLLVLMLSFLMGALFGKNLGAMTRAEVQVAGVEDTPVPPGAMDVDPASVRRADAPAATDSGPSGSLSREDYLRELESMKLNTEVLKPAPPFENTGAAKEPPVLANLNSDPASLADLNRNPDRTASNQEFIPAGAYTIQLVSLPSKAEAEALLAELKSKLYDAYLLEVNLPDKGAFYRVRVGHYNSLDQAKKALAIMQNREGKFFDAWITQ